MIRKSNSSSPQSTSNRNWFKALNRTGPLHITGVSSDGRRKPIDITFIPCASGAINTSLSPTLFAITCLSFAPSIVGPDGPYISASR